MFLDYLQNEILRFIQLPILRDFNFFIKLFVMLLLEAEESILICLTVYIVPISSAYGMEACS